MFLSFPCLIVATLVLPFPSHPIPSLPILSYPIPSYPILFFFILFYSRFSSPLLFYPILSHPILSHPILSYPILFYSILSYPILSYPILSSFSLFYSTLISPLLYYFILLHPTASCFFGFPNLSHTTSSTLIFILILHLDLIRFSSLTHSLTHSPYASQKVIHSALSGYLAWPSNSLLLLTSGPLTQTVWCGVVW